MAVDGTVLCRRLCVDYEEQTVPHTGTRLEERALLPGCPSPSALQALGQRVQFRAKVKHFHFEDQYIAWII